jgi:hypothetical protein
MTNPANAMATRRLIRASRCRMAALGMRTPDDGATCVPSDRHPTPMAWNPAGHTDGRAAVAANAPRITRAAAAARTVRRVICSSSGGHRHGLPHLRHRQRGRRD